MGRKVIKSMTLNEISSVDDPAQEGATFVIAKRASRPEQENGPDIMKTRAELEAAIAKFKTDGANDATVTAIRKAAGELKAEDLLKGTSLEVAAPAGPAQAEVDALKAEVAKMGKLSALTPEQKAAYDKMAPEDQAKLIAKSATELAADLDTEVSKSKGDDPVVYTTLSGTAIRKSAGEVVVGLARQNDDLQKRLGASEAARVDEAITKRAETDLKHLPGELPVRKALLRAVDGITDESLRGEVMKSLTAANTAAGGAFGTLGSTNGTVIAKSAADAEGQLEELAKARTSATVPYHQAYAEVIQTPEGQALYNKVVGVA